MFENIFYLQMCLSFFFRDSREQSKVYQLPHSITTWVVQGVGVSPLYGMCVADSKQILVRRDVFLDVTLPYSVKRFEQATIVATVYNYGKPRAFGNGELRVCSKKKFSVGTHVFVHPTNFTHEHNASPT